jgi:hypothetical protein
MPGSIDAGGRLVSRETIVSHPESAESAGLAYRVHALVIRRSTPTKFGLIE